MMAKDDAIALLAVGQAIGLNEAASESQSER